MNCNDAKLLNVSRICLAGMFQFKINFWNWTPFRHFGRTRWTGDRLLAKPVPSQDSTAQKNTDIHPFL